MVASYPSCAHNSPINMHKCSTFLLIKFNIFSIEMLIVPIRMLKLEWFVGLTVMVHLYECQTLKGEEAKIYRKIDRKSGIQHIRNNYDGLGSRPICQPIQFRPTFANIWLPNFTFPILLVTKNLLEQSTRPWPRLMSSCSLSSSRQQHKHPWTMVHGTKETRSPQKWHSVAPKMASSLSNHDDPTSVTAKTANHRIDN